VLIEATILRALLNEDTQFGIDLSSIGGASISLGSTKGIQSTGFAGGVAPGGLAAAFSIDDVTGFIRALEEVTDTTVLANTKILAVNKQQGAVLIGTKLGYKSQTTQNDNTTTSKVEFLETGTRLVFRPYIGNDGYIRMDIYPEDSTAVLNVITQVPDKTTTELQTNILVKDGETIVIGGLFRNVVITTRSQVPLLGDIPFLGALFRGTSDLTQREEVIVLLTPHIIEEPGETGGDQAQADIARKQDGVREGLQWIGRRRLAEDSYERALEYYKAADYEKALSEVDTSLSLRPTYLEAIQLKEKIIAR
jgi:type IV pilus assembly protein PilQ